MTNEIYILFVEDSKIMSKSDLLNSKSTSFKVKRKIQRSRKAGSSNSEKVNRYLKVVKILLVTICGLFVYKSISELNSDFVFRSVFYGAFSFGFGDFSLRLFNVILDCLIYN
jgi:hypothetical protein